MTESSPPISEVQAPTETPAESPVDTPDPDPDTGHHTGPDAEPVASPDAGTPDDAPVGSESADDTVAPIDLDRIESDLAGVEQALARLADGTYWTDEITGDTIPDEVLHDDPIARRVDRH